MRLSTASLCPSRACLLLLAVLNHAKANSFSKRGLCFVPNSTTPQDDFIWTTTPNELTWYYNYGALPSVVFQNVSQAELEFVPMLWGASGNINDTTFLNTVKALVAGGTDIRNVLTFNEPDLSQYGGSGVDPAFAAQVWVNNVIPLQKIGIRAGLPAPSGSMDSLPWLRQFLGNCSAILGRNCAYDFVTLHWYGDFQGLASHIGEYSATFPIHSIWVTEYNMDHDTLQNTQAFYNTATTYMDRLPYIERYSLFGAFRSSVSNIGPNATMLSPDGKLTNIGEWYLGRDQLSDHDETEGTAHLLAPTISTILPMVAFSAWAAIRSWW